MILLVLSLMFASSASEQCSLCHPDVRVEYEPSIHSQEMIGCADCHGGNPEAVTVEEAHTRGFKGSPKRTQIPELCSSCHSDPVLMRPYNLSTDQFALYETSRHGILLARGDSRVAVCTDCHGTHEIRPPEDPESRVFSKNIPETCGTCHGDMELMASYGKETNVYESYQESVHARALLQENNLSAPDCSKCHGVHGAAPAGIGDVSKICGNCHSAALRSFRDGPHAVGMVEAGLPECISCHDNHSTGSLVGSDLSEICGMCHEENSPQYSVGERMAVLFDRASEETEKAREMIVLAEEVPLYVEDYEARLEEARTYLLEAEPAFHSVSLLEVERFTRAARSVGEEIESEIDSELGELRLRRLGLVVFWFYLLLTVWILFRFRQNALKNQE